MKIKVQKFQILKKESTRGRQREEKIATTISRYNDN